MSGPEPDDPAPIEPTPTEPTPTEPTPTEPTPEAKEPAEPAPDEAAPALAPDPIESVEPAQPEPPPPPKPKRPSFIAERPEATIEVPRHRLAAQSRRDFLLFGAGVVATATLTWWLLPDRTKAHLLGMSGRDRLDTLAARVGLTRMRREAQLNRVLTFDDDVAEALYSRDRLVRTYERPDARPLRNNYHGRTPGPDYLAGWRLTLSGLASGQVERLPIEALRSRFARREMNTRLVCVEGWSHVAAWGGFRFGELLDAYPPAPGARWAALRSMVSLDARGEPEPYYVSLDLETARHPQSLLATHHAGAPLTLAHGAPLRLVVPMKLGLKNIKAITDIAYTADEPADYWNERGYSRYDGI